jgi:hypothetical protein
MRGLPLCRRTQRRDRYFCFPTLTLIAIQGPNKGGPLQRSSLAPGDTLLVRGDAGEVGGFADEGRFLLRTKDAGSDIQAALFNANADFADVVIPPRSGLIRQAMFPGMITPSGDLIILAIQRRGEAKRVGETVLAAGDILLLKGN